MKNISLVTEYIKKNSELKTLEIVKDKRGKKLRKVGNDYWRCYKCIDCGATFEKFIDKKIYYEVGSAIGKFQKSLENFPIKKLKYTIKDFHNTRKRFDKLMKVANDSIKTKYCLKEIEFVKNKENLVDVILEKIKNKEVVLRVTHNDTKLNNVMIDSNNKAVCLIDLDTVMPGSILFDYGDVIRTSISKAQEDEKDLRKVRIDTEIFKNITSGYLNEVIDILTIEEMKLLVISSKVIVLECGIRFLTDYLENNVYFKVDYEDHNLVRAKNQFKLLKEIEKNEENLLKIVNNVIINLKKVQK